MKFLIFILLFPFCSFGQESTQCICYGEITNHAVTKVDTIYGEISVNGKKYKPGMKIQIYKNFNCESFFYIKRNSSYRLVTGVREFSFLPNKKEMIRK